MPDTEKRATCDAKATVDIGKFTEATVECGRDPGHEEKLHVASEVKKATDKRTGKESNATLIITWE